MTRAEFPTLRTIAEAERDRRAAGYVARLQDPDPARRWHRSRVAADRAIWQRLVDWLADRSAVEPDWTGFVEATCSVARTAMKAHVHDQGSLPKSGRAADLCRLARMISIAAQFRGHEGAIDTYGRAMDLTPATERAAA